MMDDSDRSDEVWLAGPGGVEPDPPQDPDVATEDLPDPQDELVGLAGDLLTTGPRLVRLATGVGWRVSSWAWQSTWAATSRLVRAAAEGETVGHLTAEAIDGVRNQARELLGLELDADHEHLGPRRAAEERTDSEEELRRRGRRLLAASADVHYEEPNHPAYDRILDELAPDEGRILRLLYREGPQPSVDVRTAGTPVAQVGSSLVAPGLTMIGAHAGLRYTDRVPAYLNNLYRLGLVWFSREPVEDLLRYQVLEAQPDVIEALREAGRGRTVRRSIHLTPFGEDFCQVCLDVDPGSGRRPAP